MIGVSMDKYENKCTMEDLYGPFKVGDVLVQKTSGHGSDDEVDTTPWILEDPPEQSGGFLWFKGTWVVKYKGSIDKYYDHKLVACGFRKVSKVELGMRIQELQDIYKKVDELEKKSD